MKTKISAPASWGPTREIALLMADPSPALCAGTDRISAVVSGATRRQSPRPKIIPPGRISMTYDNGGKDVAGVLGAGCAGGVGARLGSGPKTPSPLKRTAN